MSRLSLVAIDRPEVPPLTISARLRSQLVYFAVPVNLAIEGELAFREDEVEKWLDEGVIELLSPLDTANMTEVELEEEQETMLLWLKKQKAWRVRIVE